MKTCNKCGEIKDLAAFYKHPQMADGYLGKCKECAKADVRANRENRVEKYRAYDRDRASRPDRVEARNAYRNTASGKAAIARAHRASNARHAERRSARVALGNALRDGKIMKPDACWYCGSDQRVNGHHADYSRPLAVTWICDPCHKEVHRMTDVILAQEAAQTNSTKMPA